MATLERVQAFLDSETRTMLQILAEGHNRSVAAEIRRAVIYYVSHPELAERSMTREESGDGEDDVSRAAAD